MLPNGEDPLLGRRETTLRPEHAWFWACASLQRLLINNSQVATFQAMGKLGSCWPHAGRDQCLLNNTELVRKNFFLLKVPLECFQTRRVLQRTRNRMRAAKSAFRQMREACMKHLYVLKGETDTFSCQGGAPRSLSSSPPQVPWFPSSTFPLSSSIGTVPLKSTVS